MTTNGNFWGLMGTMRHCDNFESSNNPSTSAHSLKLPTDPSFVHIVYSKVDLQKRAANLDKNIHGDWGSTCRKCIFIFYLLCMCCRLQRFLTLIDRILLLIGQSL